MATIAANSQQARIPGIRKAKRMIQAPKPFYLREFWAARPEPAEGDMEKAARRTRACLKGLGRAIRSFRKWDAAVREVFGAAERNRRPQRIVERATAVTTRAA